jgi:lipopolysaccharide exporter
VFSGSAFTLVTRLILKSIGLVSSIVLARILAPDDFGIIAIAMAIYAFIELFGAFGLGTVLIQRQSTSEDDYNTAWTFKVLFSVFTAAVLVVIAPYVADYYSDQRLVFILYTIAVVSVLTGAVNIGVVDFQKNMDFKKELKLQVIPKIISFVVTISLAVTLRSYWALVIGILTNHVIYLLLSFDMHPYRPSFSLSSFGSLFSFSKWLLLNNFLFYVNNRITDLIVGRVLSLREAGIYSIGNEIASIPTSELTAPINKATFPVYSKFKDNLEELQKAYFNAIGLIAGITVPAACGIGLTAPLVIEFVLGKAWLDAIELIQWMALASLFVSLSTNNGYIYLACGKPRICFYISLCRAAIFIPLLLWFLNNEGLIGVGKALFITGFLMFFVTQIMIVKFLKLKVFSIIKPIYRPIVASVAMLLAVQLFLTSSMLEDGLVFMFLSMLLGVAVYVPALLILWYVADKPEGIEHLILQKLNFRKDNTLGAGGKIK